MPGKIEKVSRVILKDWIVGLSTRKTTWDDFDKYFISLSSEDEAVTEIAELYWWLFNPENPENLRQLGEDLHQRVIIFLRSESSFGGGLKFQISIPKKIEAMCNRIFGKSEAPLDYQDVLKDYWPFLSKRDYDAACNGMHDESNAV